MKVLLFLFCVGFATPHIAIARSDAWLLMRPPRDASEPIDHWHQIAAFDTAKECAEEKVTLRELFLDYESDSDPAEAAKWTAAIDTINESRCVPAEFVYGRKPKRRNAPKKTTSQPI